MQLHDTAREPPKPFLTEHVSGQVLPFRQLQQSTLVRLLRVIVPTRVPYREFLDYVSLSALRPRPLRWPSRSCPLPGGLIHVIFETIFISANLEMQRQMTSLSSRGKPSVRSSTWTRASRFYWDLHDRTQHTAHAATVEIFVSLLWCSCGEEKSLKHRAPFRIRLDSIARTIRQKVDIQVAKGV